MTASGKLEIAASQDLGGLGAREGPPVSFNWTPVSVVPHLIPWLAILALLALKSNRAPGAWSIWAAVICGFLLDAGLRASATLIPAQPLDALSAALKSLNFGLAAVWLFSGKLEWKHRFLTFLGMLGILILFGFGTFLVSETGRNASGEEAAIGIVLGMNIFIVAVALSLGGLICRKRYQPVALLCWSAVMVVALIALIMAPFLVFAIVTNPGQLAVREFAEGFMLLAAMNFGTILVYLLLSFVSGFYRERLKGFLKLGQQEAPPLVPPLVTVEMAATK